MAVNAVYEVKSEVNVNSSDSMVGKVRFGWFLKAADFEDIFGDPQDGTAKENLQDHLGPQAPNWSGYVVPRKPDKLPEGKTWPEDAVELERNLSHGLNMTSKLGSSETHSKDHLIEVFEGAQSRLKTDRTTRVQVDGEGQVNVRKKNEEEKANEKREENEEKSERKRRKLQKQDSDLSSVSFTGGSMRKVKKFSLKAKAPGPKGTPSAHAQKTPKTVSGTTDQGWELDQKMRRKLESIEKAALALEHDSREFSMCPSNCVASKYLKTGKNIGALFDDEFFTLFRSDEGGVSEEGLAEKTKIDRMQGRQNRMGMVLESLTATKELPKVVAMKPTDKRPQVDIDIQKSSLEVAKDSGTFATRIKDMKDHGESVSFEIYEACFKRTLAQLAEQSLEDMFVDGLHSQGRVPFGVGLSDVELCVESSAEKLNQLKADALDSNVSKMMWNQDDKAKFIRFMSSLQKRNPLDGHQTLWPAFVDCLEWGSREWPQVLKSRELVKSSVKIARQFCSLPLGAKVIAEIDARMKSLNEKKTKMEKAQHIVARGQQDSTQLQLINPDQCSVPLAQFRLEYAGLQVKQKDGSIFTDDPDNKVVVEQIDKLFTSGEEVWVNKRFNNIDLEMKECYTKLAKAAGAKTASEVEALDGSIVAFKESNNNLHNALIAPTYLDQLKTFATKDRVQLRQEKINIIAVRIKASADLPIVLFADRPCKPVGADDLTKEVLTTVLADFATDKVDTDFEHLPEAKASYAKLEPIVQKQATWFFTVRLTGLTGKNEIKHLIKISSLFVEMLKLHQDLPSLTAASVHEKFVKTLKANQLKQLKDASDNIINSSMGQFAELGKVLQLLPKVCDARKKMHSFQHDGVQIKMTTAWLVLTPWLVKVLRTLVFIMDMTSSTDLSLYSHEDDPMASVFDTAGNQISLIKDCAKCLKEQFQLMEDSLDNPNFVAVIDAMSDVKPILQDWLNRILGEVVPDHCAEAQRVLKEMSATALMEKLNNCPNDKFDTCNLDINTARRHKEAGNLNDLHDELSHLSELCDGFFQTWHVSAGMPHEANETFLKVREMVTLFQLHKKMTGKKKPED